MVKCIISSAGVRGVARPKGEVDLFRVGRRIITEEKGQIAARMLLVKALQITIKSGLCLLGIKAPERM